MDKVQNNILNQYITLLLKDMLHSVAVLPIISTSWRTKCFYGQKLYQTSTNRKVIYENRYRTFLHDSKTNYKKKKVCTLSAATSDSTVRHSAYVMFTLPHNSVKLLWTFRHEQIQYSAIIIFSLQFRAQPHVIGTAINSINSTYWSCYPLQVIEKVLYRITLKEIKTFS